MSDLDWLYAQRAADRIAGAEVKYDKIVFRCPICGDSKMNKSKKRGAFVKIEGEVAYVCKNCNENSSLSWFLKNQMPELYTEYRAETFKDRGQPNRFEATVSEITRDAAFHEIAGGVNLGNTHGVEVAMPRSGTTSHFEELALTKMLHRDHAVARFINERKLWRARGYADYRWTDYFGVWAHKHDATKRLVEGYDPRIVIPCIGADGAELGSQGRGVVGQKLKYLTTSFNRENRTLCYGLNRVDATLPVEVTEGAFDADALPNGIAALHGDLSTFAVKMGCDRERTVLFFDNESSKKETRALMKKAVADDWWLAIWKAPQHEIGKDPAEIVFEKNLDIGDCVEIKRGLSAEVALARWMGRI